MINKKRTDESPFFCLLRVFAKSSPLTRFARSVLGRGSSHNVALATLYQVCLMPYGITLLCKDTNLPLVRFANVGSSHRVVGAIKNKAPLLWCFVFYGADYGARTRHLRLGKATLYQMS